jgi:hypothetical protein
MDTKGSKRPSCEDKGNAGVDFDDDRQRMVLKAVLSYAFSNVGDLSDAIPEDVKAIVGQITEEDVEFLSCYLLGERIT